jgi:hypothetical protein
MRAHGVRRRVKRHGLYAAGAAVCAWFASPAGVGRAAEGQAISFTTSPPAHAVVGGSYTVSATETSGGQVYITLTGACSFQTSAEVRTEPAPKQPSPPRPAPALVHFVEAGTCVINATGIVEYGEEPPKLSQSFPIGRGPGEVEQPGEREAGKTRRRSQTIRFISRTPAAAAVGGRPYPVVAKASSGLRVAVVSQTARVCRVVRGAVHLMHAGRCVLEATQRGDARYLAARPAHQTFVVRPH